MKLSGISKLKKLHSCYFLALCSFLKTSTNQNSKMKKENKTKQHSPQEPHHPFLPYDNTLQRYDVQKGIKNHRIEAGEVAQLEQCLLRPHNP